MAKKHYRNTNYSQNYGSEEELNMESIKEFCRNFIREEVARAVDKHENSHSRGSHTRSTSDPDYTWSASASKYQNRAKNDLIKELANIPIGAIGLDKNMTKELGKGIVKSIFDRL